MSHSTSRRSSRLRTSLLAVLGLLSVGLFALGCASPPQAPAPPEAPLAPIRVAGARWIELSPVIVAANSFYPQKLTVASGGVVSITRNEADLATNAETQLLRESVNNPDLRIIMTVSESFYRLVGRRSAGINKLSDLKGKRILTFRNTSAQYYMVAMLRSVGLKEEDVTLVTLPPSPAGSPPNKFRMADALANGEADAIAVFEPEPEYAMRKLGSDGIILQDKKVYREAFNLHARAPDLADPEKRRAIVAFVKATAEATRALKKEPRTYWPHIATILPFSEEEIGWGWPETEFPIHIIPDMLDVLEIEEQWVARERNRTPRTRAELAKFIDRSVVEEALKSK